MKRFGLVLALLLALLVSAPVRAYAQQDASQQIIPSLELDQADVRDALRALFRNVNVNYSIAPEVQGTVTVSLKNVLFETALQFILKQVDATYRIESGVYQIIHKEAVPVVNPNPGDQTQLVNQPQTVIRRIYIRSADPQLIFDLLRGSLSVTLTPEISKAKSTGGVGGGGGGGGIGGSGGGGGAGGGGGGGGVGGGGGGGGGAGGGLG